MKSDHPKKMISESRKIRKPLMEKKRRARINDSLEALKQILLESKTTLKESNGKKSGQRTAKLEKADILEMTVRYVQHLHNRLNETVNEQEIKKGSSVRQADRSTERSIKMGVTLIPTKLNNGDIVFVMPSNLELTQQQQQQISVKINENVWRPW